MLHQQSFSSTGEDEMLFDDTTPVTFGENKKSNCKGNKPDLSTQNSNDDKLSTLFNTTGREKNSTGPLKHWLFEHQHHPYPNETDKQELMEKTKMSLSQITVWFTNARVKMRKENKLPLNIYSKKKKKKQQDDSFHLDDTLSPPLSTQNLSFNELSTSFDNEYTSDGNHEDTYASHHVIACPSTEKHVVMAYSCLTYEQVIEIQRFVSLFPNKIKLSNCVDEHTTHLIVGNEEKPLLCPLTIKLFQAIARHLFVLTHRWISECLKQNQLIDATLFEIRGDLPFGEYHDGMRHSRLSKHQNLFQHCQFFILCDGCQEKMSKTELAALIHLCNGTLLNTLPIATPNDPSILTIVLCDKLLPFESSKQQHLLERSRANGVNYLSPEWCLTIQQIQFYQILLLINHLNCLANFSSLTIQTSDYFQDENSIYLAIFRLAKLKFCKLTFPSGGQRIPLPLAIDQCQTLECLVLNGHCRLDQLISILSYVPKLHHLACEQLSGSEYIDITRIPENLTSISLTPYRISFNELKLLLTSKISFKLKKLRIKIFNNETFFHAEQWEELILNYMPCLHSFDLQYTGLIDECCQLNLIAPFHSKFWIDRQWSFDYYYHSYGCDDLNYLTFFSIVPYRSNHYTLYEPLHNDICESFQNNSINFARHLTIHRCVEFDKYSIRFSRVTKLTLKNNSIKKNASFMKNINSLVPLIQITDLDIKNNNLSIIQLSKILCLLPNLQSLSLSNTSLFHSKHNTTVNLSSRNNKITKLIIDDDDDEWDIKHIQFLLRLFPYLQYLEIGIDENNLDDILQYLLLKFKSLFSLFLLNVNHEATKKIETFIKSENLIHDYTIEHIRGGLYLWW
ncbi:unnamed protein product [Rotaria socialis]|uniref:Homeobox domain-containing protein n=1 Tax=Rotaria socialis TaxID=392032 RepID=A0A820I6N4_9BILA|nr:unnamed protein product [Rotaria socialis]